MNRKKDNLRGRVRAHGADWCIPSRQCSFIGYQPHSISAPFERTIWWARSHHRYCRVDHPRSDAHDNGTYVVKTNQKNEMMDTQQPRGTIRR